MEKLLQHSNGIPLTQLSTGDLLFFGGTSWKHVVARCFTHSRSVHVAMVYWPFNEELSLFHSERARQKVSIVPFEDELRKMYGSEEILVRKLSLPNEQLRSQFEQRLEHYSQSVIGKPYEQRMFRTGLSLCCWKSTWQDLSSFLCSELIVDAYEKSGLIHSGQLNASRTITADLLKPDFLPFVNDQVHLELAQPLEFENFSG